MTAPNQVGVNCGIFGFFFPSARVFVPFAGIRNELHNSDEFSWRYYWIAAVTILEI